MPEKLYVCSSNPGKLRDFALGLSALTIEPLPGLQSIAPPEESGVTFEENARLKAIYYSGFTDQKVLADDSGLEVDALGGAPGVLSARYSGAGATDESNNALLLRNLERENNRAARYVAVLCVAQNGRLIAEARGTVEGLVLRELRGPGGFGYDPLFFYPPLGKSFGELSDEVRATINHRGNALRQLDEQLT